MRNNIKIGMVCCSNAQKAEYKIKIDELEQVLHQMGLSPQYGSCIYEENGSVLRDAKERAEALMDFYQNDEIQEIFDISGGDVANGVLPCLDYSLIAKQDKRFWGYSDLTTVINAIYAKTGKESILYQIKNLVYDHYEQQRNDFENTILCGGTDLFNIDVRFVQGQKMQGIVVGGNIRCFLKLAGTEYMPDLQDKILLLESYGGTVTQMETYLCQLKQIGAFQKVSGILLGTFTQMEAEGCVPSIESMVKQKVGHNIPIAITRDIGHGTNAKGIIIGRENNF